MNLFNSFPSRRIALLFLSTALLLPSALTSRIVNGPAVTNVPPHSDVASSSPKVDPLKPGLAYVAILRGRGFGTNPSALSVRINGIDAPDVLLHNSTALSFRIPNSMVQDDAKLHTSFVEISVGVSRYFKVPLATLKPAMSIVDLKEFKAKVEQRKEESLRGEREGEKSGESDDGSDDADEVGDGDDEDLDIVQRPQDEDEDEDEDGDAANLADTRSEDSEDMQDNGELDEDDSEHGVADEETAEREAEIDGKVLRAQELLSQKSGRSSREALRLLEEAIEHGDARAMTVVGMAYLSGGAPGASRDVHRAVEYLQRASQKGYPDAQAMLGFLYASGLGGTALRKDIGAALLMWSFAAEGGSMYAKMALGYRYFTGTDIQEDCEKASEYYREVADEVFLEAKEALDRQTGRQRQEGQDDDDSMAEIRPPTPSAMLSSDRKRLTEGMQQRVLGEANEVVQYYRHSADRGDASAQVVMGNLYYYGAIDMPQDIDRARRLFQMAADTGHADAHAHLGFMDLRAGRNDSAVTHLQAAAERNNRLGLHGMGFVLLHGIGVPKNEQLAAQYFQKAIEKEHPEAMFNLAIMFSKGIGVPQSSEEAYRLYQLAARHGHIQSNYNVGIMMLKGIAPAKKHCTMATQYLKLVAQQGVWNKILSKAFRAYERGAYADALFRYLQAAHAGIELAQYNAAFMYEHNTLINENSLGLGTWIMRGGDKGFEPLERSDVVEEALELYQMSASQGHSDSMVRMGDLVFGETKDFARAASVYEKAVKLRNAEAMFNLGWMHARGFGMNPDKHMAKRYFDQAKDTDDDAFLPATIAVYSLKYSDSVHACFDKVSKITDQIRLFASGSGDEEATFAAHFYADLVIYAILFAILQLVLVIRRRRLTRRGSSQGERRRENEEAAPEHENIREDIVNQHQRGGHEHQD